jgi:hypothetical protein
VLTGGKALRPKLGMAWRWRRRSWPFHLLTLIGCGFFAARAAGQYLSSAAPAGDPAGLRRKPLAAAGAAPPARPPPPPPKVRAQP